MEFIVAVSTIQGNTLSMEKSDHCDEQVCMQHVIVVPSVTWELYAEASGRVDKIEHKA